MLTRLERYRGTRIHRLAFSVVIACACLYVAMVAVDGLKYAGPAPALISYTLRSLIADVFDALSIYSYHLTGKGLGPSARPTRFALICAADETNESDNAVSERQVRQQVVHNKSGSFYALMTAAMKDGREQPVFVLTRYGYGGTRFCAVRSYPDQECTCGGQYRAKERSRILARELFSSPGPMR